MSLAQCNRCGLSNTKFKFFNNKKRDQPRYQCLDCTAAAGKPYFFNGNPIRPQHKDGYAKLPKEETEELKQLEKVCDKCHAVNNAKFRGYNNGNAKQPRYVCRGCNRLFSPLKKTKVAREEEDTPGHSRSSSPNQSAATSAVGLHIQQGASLQQRMRPAPGVQPLLHQTLAENHQEDHRRSRIPQQQQIIERSENQQPQFQIPIPQQQLLLALQDRQTQLQTPILHQQQLFALENQQPGLQTAIQQQLFAFENQRPQFQTPFQSSYPLNPRASLRSPQVTPIVGVPLPHLQPAFQYHHYDQADIQQQQQFGSAPWFQQPHHPGQILWNPGSVFQQEPVQQLYSHASFQNDRNIITAVPGPATIQIAPRNQPQQQSPLIRNSFLNPSPLHAPSLRIMIPQSHPQGRSPFQTPQSPTPNCSAPEPASPPEPHQIIVPALPPGPHQSGVPTTQGISSEEYGEIELIYDHIFTRLCGDE